MNGAAFAPMRRTTTLPTIRDFVPRQRVTVCFYEVSGVEGRRETIWLDELPRWLRSGRLIYAVCDVGGE